MNSRLFFYCQIAIFFTGNYKFWKKKLDEMNNDEYKYF